MKKIQQGFTLIELMIVVAIIGILAALALPAYQDYTGRAQFSESLTVAGGLKTDVLDYVGQNGACPDNSAGAQGSIKEAAKYTTKYLDKVEPGTGVAATDCAITATFKATGVNKKLVSKKVRLNGEGVLDTSANQKGTVDWKCATDADFTVVPNACQTAL